jgi:hypothetical protein
MQILYKGSGNCSITNWLYSAGECDQEPTGWWSSEHTWLQHCQKMSQGPHSRHLDDLINWRDLVRSLDKATHLGQIQFEGAKLGIMVRYHAGVFFTSVACYFLCWKPVQGAKSFNLLCYAHHRVTTLILVQPRSLSLFNKSNCEWERERANQ